MGLAKHRQQTTIGWEFLIQWKDSSTSWIPLKDLKNSHPIQSEEYAVANQLSHEPAFARWVQQTLKKHNRIIEKVKSHYWLRTHKFGIVIPKSVGEAKRFDEANGNSLWWDAILKEMKNVQPAFEIHDGEPKELIGYQQISCHMIFDVKMGENGARLGLLLVDTLPKSHLH